MASHRQRPAERIERDLQAIGALAQAVLDGDDLEQLLGRVAHEARELVEAMSAVVVTVSGESGMMTFRAVDGVSIGPLKVGHVMPARDTLTEMALTRGTNIVASGIDDLPLVGQQFARATGAGPLIASPLARIGSARGVLVVARATDAAPFRPGEVTLVSTFAAQAASAIALFDLRATESLLAAEAERQRIAGDLHTGVIGALLEVRFGVQALAVGDDLQRTAAIESAVARLDEAIETVRRYVAELGA
jgi:signal transduction histidine kinase